MSIFPDKLGNTGFTERESKTNLGVVRPLAVPERIEYMSHRVDGPDLANDNVWDDVVKKVKAKGRETLREERKSMLERGIIDDAGRSIYKSLPRDMMEQSRTSVAT